MFKTLATIAITALAVDIDSVAQKNASVKSDVSVAAAVALGATVSSSNCWDQAHCNDRARLNFSSNQGASSWCARFNDKNQWIQVYFGGQRQLITEVATQGRGDAK